MMLETMQFKLTGGWPFRLRSILILLWSGIFVAMRRLLRGPQVPDWSLLFEASTHYQRAVYKAVYSYADINDGREMIDALVVQVPALKKVNIKNVNSLIRGAWFNPGTPKTDRAILYCHGAYAFYAQAERGFVAQVAEMAQLPVFALDYRLTPEHPFPAQLEDALAAYDWLIESGYQGEEIVLMGTSAGGNLCLSMLLEIRDTKRPHPKFAVCISPWTDIGNSGASIDENEWCDILDRDMLEQGAKWFIGDDSAMNPRISPLHADLGGLPPVYIQAGGKEIFIDMIRAFGEKAKDEGLEVELEIWESMNHVFQAYGNQVPEAKEAMKKLALILNQES